MPFAKSNGAEVCYEATGQGEAILMIPGIASDHRHWARVAAALPNFRCITIDNRGSGQTRYQGTPTIEEMAEDALAVLDAEGITKANVIGWSMGSHVGLCLAARHPERVKTLCLVSSYIRKPARSAYVLKGLGEAYQEKKIDASIVSVIFNTMIHSEEWFEHMAASGKTIHNAEMADPKMFVDQLMATQMYDPAPHAALINMPVLSIHGTEDIMTEPRFGDELADSIKGCVKIRIPGEGHFVNPAKYMEDYVKFIMTH